MHKVRKARKLRLQRGNELVLFRELLRVRLKLLRVALEGDAVGVAWSVG